MWVNSGEIYGDRLDNDRNGFIDDVYGWDFVNDTNNPRGDRSHANHVAGIIAARHDRHGTSGIAPEVTLMNLKVLDSNGSGRSQNVADAITYAISNGARIINLSLSGPVGLLEDRFCSVVHGVMQKNPDILFVAAAGNRKSNIDHVSSRAFPAIFLQDNVINGIKYPALNNLMIVTATDFSGNLWGRSNYSHNSVHLAAPGSTIRGVRNNVRRLQRCSIDTELRKWVTEPDYVFKSGTSMATAFVSGTAALMLSVDKTLKAPEIIQHMMETVTVSPSLEGRVMSGGVLNIVAALKSLSPQTYVPMTLLFGVISLT